MPIALRTAYDRATHSWLPVHVLVLAILILIDYQVHEAHRALHIGVTALILVHVMYLAGAFGVRGAIVTAGAAAGLILDEMLIAMHTESLLSEVVQASAMVFVGGAIGLVAEREIAMDRGLRRRLAENIALTGGVGAYWQRVSLTNMGTYVTRIESSFIARALARTAPKRVVDVGTGRGRLLFQLLDSAGSVVATEINRDDLLAIAASPRTDRLLVGPDQTLPFQAAYVEALIAIEVPAASDAVTFKAECARVVEPGGSVIVTMQNSNSYKRLLRRLRAWITRTSDESWEDVYYTTSFAEQRREWEANGFEFVRGCGFSWAPFTRSSDSVWISTASVIERLLGLRNLLAISPWVIARFRRR